MRRMLAGLLWVPIAAAGSELDFAAMIQPAPRTAKFVDPDYYIWCGTLVRGDDEKCHLFYSRWPRRLGHNAWVTHSEVAHAVARDAVHSCVDVDALVDGLTALGLLFLVISCLLTWAVFAGISALVNSGIR